MTSVSRLGRAAAPFAAVLLCGGLAGCVSTQQKAAWLHIQDARIIASQSPTVVRAQGPEVRVERISVLHRGAEAVFVVRLRNLTGRRLSDLPISVGFASGHRRVYLNRSSALDYFASHLAALDAHGTISWVFRTRLRTPPAGLPFALVGPHPAPAINLGNELPRVTVKVAQAHGGRLELRVTNLSSVPQLQLPLYAVSARDGRVTAAGLASIASLGAGATARVELNLLGHADSTPQLEALPTMFLP